MDTPSSNHPTDQNLSAFGLGKLDERATVAITTHLERCLDCRKRVAELSADSFLVKFRDAKKPTSQSSPGQSLFGGTLSYKGSHAPPPADTLPPGLADHPDYEIKRELGRGGMGVVYLAHNKLMGRDEVLKVMGRQIIEKPGVLDRFLREIRAVAKLRHPNIVTAFSATRIGDSIVFAMEYVEGLDLSRMVKAKGPLPVSHACLFVHQTALGLQHAHEEGLVHRDIKPANLMFTKRNEKPLVKVLDFGLAKATREEKIDSSLTFEGQALGTPDFIAPEQILDAPNADIRADIYSLGGTLYYLLTGRPPFKGNSTYDIYQAHISRDADPLNFVRTEVPSELAALVAKMMAKEPRRRFQTPGEVAEALKPFFKKTNTPLKSRPQDALQNDQPIAPAISKTPQPVVVLRESALKSEKAPVPTVAETGWGTLIDFRESESAEESTPVVKPTRRPPWASWPYMTTATLLAFIVIGVIIIKIRDKYGETTITAPDDKAFEIEKNGIVIKQKPSENDMASDGSGGSAINRIPGPDLGRGNGHASSNSPPKRVKNSIEMTLVLIPAGEFQMGCLDGNENEKPPHQVRISKPFYLGAFEVTQQQYETIKRKNPSHFSGRPMNPVEDVSWIDAITFCNLLSEHETIPPYYRILDENKVTILGGSGYRLPTEAEWEYAARAGNLDNFPFRDDTHLGRYAWMYSNCDRITHPVGKKEANAFGLYDMYGNVWEWCWDWLGDYQSSLSIDPIGPATGRLRVLHGNGWWNGAHNYCRPSFRLAGPPQRSSPNHDFGFRVAAGGIHGLPTIALESPAAGTPSPPTSDANAWAKLMARQRPDSVGPTPFACWTFESDTRDEIGSLHGRLLGGAALREGRLYLNGKQAYVRTEPLPRDIREKTLEAWVTLSNLEQRGGGVVTIERGSTFDSIVFGEQETGKWMSGSEFFRRTKRLAAPIENAKPTELIHIAIVHDTWGGITFYRNGQLNADTYVPAGNQPSLQTYPAGESCILLGLRCTDNGPFNRYLAGAIEEARLYDRALTANEVAASYRAGVIHQAIEGKAARGTDGLPASAQSGLAQALVGKPTVAPGNSPNAGSVLHLKTNPPGTYWPSLRTDDSKGWVASDPTNVEATARGLLVKSGKNGNLLLTTSSIEKTCTLALTLAVAKGTEAYLALHAQRGKDGWKALTSRVLEHDGKVEAGRFGEDFQADENGNLADSLTVDRKFSVVLKADDKGEIQMEIGRKVISKLTMPSLTDGTAGIFVKSGSVLIEGIRVTD